MICTPFYVVDSCKLYVVFLGPIPGVSVPHLFGGVESGAVLHPQSGLSASEGVAPVPGQHLRVSPQHACIVCVHGLSLDLYGHLFGSSQLDQIITWIRSDGDCRA